MPIGTRSLIALGLIALVPIEISNAQVRSTAEGGPWGEASTWVGGAVPDSMDHVVVTSGAVVDATFQTKRAASLTVETGATISGSIVVFGDVLLQGQSNDLRLTSFGAVHNEGTMQFGSIYAAGDVFDEGTWDSGRLYLFGTQPRTVRTVAENVTISGFWSFDSADFVPPRPVLAGDNVMRTFYAPPRGGDLLVVDPGASLTVLDNNILPMFGYENGFWLENYGEIVLHHPTIDTQFEPYRVEGHGAMFDLVPAAVPDSVTVTTYGHQAPDGFPNAVRRYWDVVSYSASGAVVFTDVQFQAMGPEMPPVEPDSLALFHSTDGGASWTRLESTSMRTQESLTEWGTILHTITVEGTFPLSGMYALAAAEPTQVRNNIMTQIIGRDQIRVGGPLEEYRIHIQNTGDTRVFRGLLRLDTGGGIYIDHIVSHAHGAGAEQGLRFDQTDFSLYDDSTSAMLVTPELAAGESRVISAFLGALPGYGLEAPPGKKDPLLWGAIAGGVAVGIFKGYLTDLAAAALEETLADPCGDKGTVQDKMNAAFDAADQKWSPFSVGPWNAVADNAASSVADDADLIKVFSQESSAINRALGKANALNDLKTMADGVSNGFDRYESNTGRSVYEPLECGDDPPPQSPDGSRFKKTPELVNSFDPNAKLGPNGAGAAGFISAGGTFTYRILFENLAEATAPAYRVVIVDTLAEVFDVETVRTTEESHEGFAFSRENNVLRWEIVGIELPPNLNPPEGEGFVEFTVETERGLLTGTELANRAEIVFDLNEPILTNTHLNTLDYSPPITTISPLADVSMGDSLTVAWLADDGENGSGAASTALFMSINDGPFHQVGITTVGSLRLPVTPDHDYAFYALSKDAAGNAETEISNIARTSVAVSAEDAELPPQFALHDAYPNPFNPSTTIAFDLAQSGQVSLRIFNVLGQQVGRSNWGAMDVGRFSRTVDFAPYASGVYFYEIRVENRAGVLFRDVGRAVFVK